MNRRKRKRRDLFSSVEPHEFMEDLRKAMQILTKLMGSIAPKSQTLATAAAASSSSSSTRDMIISYDDNDTETEVTSAAPTPTRQAVPRRKKATRRRQIAHIKGLIEKSVLEMFIKINYAAPVRFSLLDHAFVVWCYCNAYECDKPIPTTFRGQHVRAIFELMLRQLEPFAKPEFPDDLRLSVAHMIVGIFGRDKDPVHIEADKNAWQPPLLPANPLAQADEEQRQRLHVAYSVLGVYTHSNHYIPNADDPNARLPPIEMRQAIDSITFSATGARLWFWTMFRQKLLSCKTIKYWKEGQQDLFEAASVRLTSIVEDNARIEFQPKSELFVRDICLFRLCPIGALPAQMRIQHCVRASVLSASSVYQGERGFNNYNKYGETLKLRYPKFQIELRERKGEPRMAYKDGTEIKPPGTSEHMTMDEMELVNTAWTIAIVNRWISQNTRWRKGEVVVSLQFTKQFIIFEHELATKADILLKPKRDAETRRPLIVEIQHKFYVHYFPPYKRKVVYALNNYIIVPDPRHPDPILVECTSFKDAFCKWCYVMREFYDSRIEQRLTMKHYIDQVLEDNS